MGFGDISIHAPREGGDVKRWIARLETEISIHAPREGGDCADKRSRRLQKRFNPRPPRGGRRHPLP